MFMLKAVAVYSDETKESCLCSGNGIVSLQTELIYAGEELSFVEITARDESGMIVPSYERKIELTYAENIELIGLGSARTKTQDSYASNITHLYRGRALAVFRGTVEISKLMII